MSDPQSVTEETGMSDSQNMDGGEFLAAFLTWSAIVCLMLNVGGIIQISWWWFLPLGILALPYLLMLVLVMSLYFLFKYHLGQFGALLALALLVPACVAGLYLIGEIQDEKERSRIGRGG